MTEQNTFSPQLPLKAFLKSRLLPWTQSVVTPLALGCLGYFGWMSRDTLTDILESAEWRYLAIAVLWLVVRNLSQALPTFLILKGLSGRVPWYKVLQITIERLPARYIPGGIWNTAAQALDLKTMGVPFDLLSGMFFLRQVLPIGSAIVMGGLGLSLFHPDGRWRLYGGAVSLAALAVMVACCLVTIVLLKRRGHAPRKSVLGSTVVLSVVFWLAPALGFDAIIDGFPKVEVNASAALTASVFLFSRGIGFLAIFAPQGIGVFEFVAASLLPSAYEATSIAVVLFSFRIVGFAADTLTYLVFAALRQHPALRSLFAGDGG